MIKKLLLSAAILFLCLQAATAQTKARIQGYVEQGGKSVQTSPTVTHKVQGSFPNSTVTVYLTGTTTLAAIYLNDAGTTKSNPFTADNYAYYFFYADNGTYDIKFSGTGIVTPFTIAGVTALNVSADNKTWYDAIDDCGLVGDGVVDDTVALQTCLNDIGTAGIDATIFFPATENFYKIGGALQDTSGSNSQIVFPTKTTGEGTIAIRLLGATPASNYYGVYKGSVIESTLTTGNGSVFGCKNAASTTIPNACHLAIHVENISLRMPSNPTNSGWNFNYVVQGGMSNCKTGAKYTGTLIGGIVEPTTSTSYAYKLPLNNIPAHFYLNNVHAIGMYNGFEFGELAEVTHITTTFCIWGGVFTGAFHQALDANRLLITNGKNTLKFTGSSPSRVNIRTLDVEHNLGPSWLLGGVDIEDPSNLARGKLGWYLVLQDTGVHSAFTQNGGFYLWTERLNVLDDTASYDTANPFIRVRNDAHLSIPNAAFTNVTFNVEDSVDSALLHSTILNTHRFVCTKEGKAHIKFTGEFAANATGIRQARIFKYSGFTATSYLLDWAKEEALAGGITTTVSVDAYSVCSSPGDYFYIEVAQNSGVALNLLASSVSSATEFFSPLATFSISR